MRSKQGRIGYRMLDLSSKDLPYAANNLKQLVFQLAQAVV
jgi:hypothetical protein